MRDSNKIMRALFFVLRFWREQNAAAEWQANDRQGYYTFSTKKWPVLPLLLLLRTALLKQTIGEGAPIGLADSKEIQRGEGFGRTQMFYCVRRARYELCAAGSTDTRAT